MPNSSKAKTIRQWVFAVHSLKLIHSADAYITLRYISAVLHSLRFRSFHPKYFLGNFISPIVGFAAYLSCPFTKTAYFALTLRKAIPKQKIRQPPTDFS